MLTEMRGELNALLMDAVPSRKIAMRRADSDAWLLASDVPQLMDEASLQRLENALSARGWTTMQKGGWMYFDHAIEAPRIEERPRLTGEAACVASLLERHPSEAEGPEMARALVKAAEQGKAQTEKLCRTLHGELAQRLRLHEPLPSKLLPLLLAAFSEKT